MKLFSLLMGSSAPVPVVDSEPTMADEKELATAISPPVPPEPVAPCPVVPPPSHHVSLNLDKLRKIFQTLSSINENKSEEIEVDEEPLRMRRTFQSIFERFERRFTLRTNGTRQIKRPRTLRISREKLLALLSRRSANGTSSEESSTMRNWAKTSLNRLTTSMRHVKSDSFIAKKIAGRSKLERSRAAAVDEGVTGSDEIHLPCMKTKKRSSVSRSKALISSASQVAHEDLVKHLEKNSSQHCLDELDFRNFDYPFENLVFEGGGAKVHTYIGAIKVSKSCRVATLRRWHDSTTSTFIVSSE